MPDIKKENVRKIVRDRYGKVARQESSCCGPSPVTAEEVSKAIGYSQEELNSIPGASNMGLGCGNPTALASLKEGEVVVDLGAGGGLDCFLAAQKIGQAGKVIGVDMTPDMVELARENARKNDITNVEFRLGEIENLPIADNSADVVISNCVINLSPEKQRVFEETFRILKPGGRITISDIVLLRKLPESVRNNEALLAGCVAGAELKDRYIQMIEDAGFIDVRVVEKDSGLLIEKEADESIGERTGETIVVVDGQPLDVENFDDIKEDIELIGKSVQSITVTAFKPK